MEMLEDMMDKTKAGKVMNPIVAETSHVDLHIFSELGNHKNVEIYLGFIVPYSTHSYYLK